MHVSLEGCVRYDMRMTSCMTGTMLRPVTPVIFMRTKSFNFAMTCAVARV